MPHTASALLVWEKLMAGVLHRPCRPDAPLVVSRIEVAYRLRLPEGF